MGEVFKTCQPSTMARAAFVAAFADIYEHSPWVAEGTFDRGLTAEHDLVANLHLAMSETVRASPVDARLKLLRAHPDLGGKVAVALTAASTAEQRGAGLSDCTPDEFARFQALNAAYTERFRFPFIMAVKGSSRSAILTAFEARIRNSPQEELERALVEVNKIAFFRLSER